MTSSAEMNDRLRRTKTTTRPTQEPGREAGSDDGTRAPSDGSALLRAAMEAARARRRH